MNKYIQVPNPSYFVVSAVLTVASKLAVAAAKKLEAVEVASTPSVPVVDVVKGS